MTITLRIDGAPKAKGRARATSTGRVYTPAQTRTAEQRVQGEWIAAGRPRMPDGPLCMIVEAILARPAAHYRTDGTLNAAGRRSAWPTRRPDIDNVWKLVADALNGQAFTDDAQVVSAAAWKRWANPGEHEHVRVHIEAAPVPNALQRTP